MNKLRAVLKRRWPLLVVVTVFGLVVGAISGALANSDQVVSYTASQTVVANKNSSGYNGLVPQDMLRITRGQVPEQAAIALGQPERAAALAGKITTAFDDTSSSIRISATSTDPAEAARVTAAFVDAFLEMTNSVAQAPLQQQIDDSTAQRDAAQAELAAFDAEHPDVAAMAANPLTDELTLMLIEQRSSLQSNLDSAADNLRSLERDLQRAVPYESLGPESPRVAEGGLLAVPASAPVRSVLLGLIGLLLGAVVTLVLERTMPRVDTRGELAILVDTPIIAEVGFLKEKDRPSDADGVLELGGGWSEPFRAVRSAIQFVQSTADPGSVPRTFLITSTMPGEGKSTTSALVSKALAEVGVPTLVVGGDFRKPEVHRLLGATSAQSLQDMAKLDTERATIDEIIQFPEGVDNLFVAAAGAATREVSAVIAAARGVCVEGARRGATVIVDSSPLSVANDTVDLLPVVDYVILVVRSGMSTEKGLLESLDTIERAGRKVLGMVLIGTPDTGRQYAYYYHDYFQES